MPHDRGGRGGDANMTRCRFATLMLVALSLAGCVIVPVARPAYVARPVAVVAPVGYVGVRVYR